MKRCLAFTLFAVSSMATTAWSQCNKPSSPGVVICTPTNGATVDATPKLRLARVREVEKIAAFSLVELVKRGVRLGNRWISGYPSPLPVYWNHRLSRKSRSNLWRSTA